MAIFKNQNQTYFQSRAFVADRKKIYKKIAWSCRNRGEANPNPKDFYLFIYLFIALNPHQNDKG
jgi:hypothetical protein